MVMLITHLAIGILFYLLLLNVKNLPASTLGFIIFIFGVMIPDIDHKNSKISNKIKPLSWLVRIFTKHRGFTHSLSGAIVFSFGFMLVLQIFNITKPLTIWFFLGYIAHLVGDSLTPQGVNWLHPLTKKRIKFFVRTGSLTETLILSLVLLLVIKIGWTIIF